MSKTTFTISAVLTTLFVITHSAAATDVGERQNALSESSASQDSQSDPAVGLFEAMEQKLVTVRFIPLSAAQANVIIKNETTTQLQLELPETFGAVHVLGQFGGPGGGIGPGGGGGPGGGFGPGAGQGAGGGFGGGQGLGGGFGAGGQGNAGGNFGGGNQFGGGGAGIGPGLFRVAPNRTRKVSVSTVCLEHGKPDPNPRLTYRLVPLNEVNGSPDIKRVCSELAQGGLSQAGAQAAAWHIADGLSWGELAEKNRRESRYTGNEKFFTASELRAAYRLVTAIEEQSRQASQSLSP